MFKLKIPKSKAVFPSLFFKFTFAPLLIKRSTIFLLTFLEACLNKRNYQYILRFNFILPSIKAVCPILFVSFILAPFFNKISTISL